jgi:tetratricopeptide (TPR) repeat protein
MAISNFKDLINSGYNDENVFINLAILQLEEKDTLGALETIDKGKQIFETNKNLINLELDLYLKLGRSEELITKLNQAVDQDPYNPIYYFARAVTYEGMKKFDLAEQDYNKAIEANSGYYDAYYNLGVMYTNRAAEIIEEMNSKDNLKMADYDAYKSKYEALYKKSLAFFETVFNENVDMKKADKLELADVMKKLYAQISDMDNFNAMKKFIEENK